MKIHLIWVLILVLTSMSTYWLTSKLNEESNTNVFINKIIPEETYTENLLIVPEGWRRLEDYTMAIDIAVMAGEFDSIWVEYGLDGDNLRDQTLPISSGLGMGTRGEYGLFSVTIPHNILNPGVSYFYRVAGETTDGKIIKSGLSRFTAGK